MSAAYDPTLPLGAAITFCVYRLFAKRKQRAPDGPYWGNSPVWGALGTTLLGLLAGGVVRSPADACVRLTQLARSTAERLASLSGPLCTEYA